MDFNKTCLKSFKFKKSNPRTFRPHGSVSSSFHNLSFRLRTLFSQSDALVESPIAIGDLER